MGLNSSCPLDGRNVLPGTAQTGEGTRAIMRSLLIWFLSISTTTVGQTGGKLARPEYLDSGKVPTFAEPLLRVLGDRLGKPGKERLAFMGTLADAKGNRQIRVLLELPLKGRIEDLGAGGGTFTLDEADLLKSNKSTVSDQELDLVESLILDRQEAILYGLAQGDGARLLGRGFPLVPGQGKGYRGPVYDIIDLTSKTEFRSDRPQRFRRCYFDSATSLLHKVQYAQVRGGRTIKVETVVRQWVELQGQRVPSAIERIEDGQPVFTVQLTGQGIGAKVSDGVFTK